MESGDENAADVLNKDISCKKTAMRGLMTTKDVEMEPVGLVA